MNQNFGTFIYNSLIKGVANAKDENLKNGLGGSFTYGTLGDEISPETLLRGDKLPDYDTLARHLYWMATGKSPDKINPKTKRGKDGLFYETPDKKFYLVYEPKLAFLRGSASALDGDRAERITRGVKERQ